MPDPFDSLDIKVVTIVYDGDIGRISIDFDETVMDNIYVYGLIKYAYDIQKHLLNAEELDVDDEED